MLAVRDLASVFLLLLAIGCGGAQGAREVAPAFPPPTPRLAANARAVHAHFDPERALATVAYVDRFFRVRGNEGYQSSLRHVQTSLAAQGFDLASMRLVQLGEERATWTPRRARLALIGDGGSETELVAFADESERDRAALLVGSDAMAPVELEVVRIEAVRAGTSARGRLVLAEGEPRPLFRELASRGAVGVLVKNLAPYHRGDDAAQFGYLPAHEGQLGIGFSLSEEDWRALRAATERGIARVRVEIAVRSGRSAATALEARIEGTEPDAGAIVFVAHVDEPGANDNASGVGALAELAVALRRAIEEGAVRPPTRTLVFLWGQEIEVAREWLEREVMPVSAGLVLDMVGQDPTVVGAPFLIERMPDPGAVWLRAPDEHSEWGQSEVDPARLRGHFLNDWLRASIASVQGVEGAAFPARAHPFEGGSDHVAFLERGLPAVLAWHFTDDAYHTTRDRLDRVSGAEMRRVAAVLGGAALSMASGERGDREEMIAVVRAAGLERLAWAEHASREEIASGGALTTERLVIGAWGDWYDEALRSIDAWDGEDEALRAAITEAREAIAARTREAEATLR
ncbi:M28 family peptidase [Sandaracinus amylolyticus]|uniref:Aminopeptidase, family M28 n=1 Tax=Sandaracinus amylolyticus TaxID=927083 RepID=A0A0F6SE78_9BACT|nr:M28 family peptidase [Sandaracinus amylolyticus]AKF04719.1 Aminopeptidase, family M28 [Sandaracinus amylolyticus]